MNKLRVGYKFKFHGHIGEIISISDISVRVAFEPPLSQTSQPYYVWLHEAMVSYPEDEASKVASILSRYEV